MSPALASGLATVLVGLAGFVCGALALSHPIGPVRWSWALPLTGMVFRVDALGGLVMSTTGAVAVAVGVYAIGYGRREHLPRFALIALPLFVVTLLMVPAAGSVTTFLAAWELMAVTSLVLVLTDHRRAAVRSAGLFYAVITQIGFAVLLLGLLVLVAAAGADTFADLGDRVGRVSGATRDVVFVATVVGFGSKAGLLPLHAWLPRAHPEAPSPVSALMSAVMVGMGIYGLIRFDVGMLGPGPQWWGITLLAVGAVSAVYGVLHASVATDLKRLLAFSTIENMGLIVTALGAALVLRAVGAPALATVAMTAALLHLVAHAAFKTLAFLGAGSVLAGTGLRDLDRWGGLARRMPYTTVFFGVAALGACGLPLGAGFVSEWLLLQSMIHAPRQGATALALAMPLVVGMMALTTGLAVAAMVKAFGVGFLARPRSPEAERAREADPTMRAGMGLAAAACLVFAVAPVIVARPLAAAIGAGPESVGGGVDLGTVLRLPGSIGSISPWWLLVATAGASLLALGLARWGARHRPAAEVAPLWACGADRLSSRMQYTATSFAEPLQRVFDDVLRPDIDVEIGHFTESRYLVEAVGYRARPTDAVERQLYDPVLRCVRTWAGWVRRAHNGSVHTYLLYGALGLLVVLVVAW
jgi:formate hydrogenlyase subunit 3/multisubunit Na+/H+ antiporter MnhD subunit